MVLGELAEPVVAQQIPAAVAHLADQEPRLEQSERGDRRSHAPFVMLGERALEDGAVRGPNRDTHALRYLLVAQTAQRIELAGDVAHRHLARHLTRRMTAHAVGDEEDPAVGDHEVAVLIPRPDDADVGATS